MKALFCQHEGYFGAVGCLLELMKTHGRSQPPSPFFKHKTSRDSDDVSEQCDQVDSDQCDQNDSQANGEKWKKWFLKKIWRIEEVSLVRNFDFWWFLEFWFSTTFKVKFLQLQWGSEIRTNLDFEWSKKGWVANVPDLKWLQFCQKPFEIKKSGFQMVRFLNGWDFSCNHS